MRLADVAEVEALVERFYAPLIARGIERNPARELAEAA